MSRKLFRRNKLYLEDLNRKNNNVLNNVLTWLNHSVINYCINLYLKAIMVKNTYKVNNSVNCEHQARFHRKKHLN